MKKKTIFGNGEIVISKDAEKSIIKWAKKKLEEALYEDYLVEKEKLDYIG